MTKKNSASQLAKYIILYVYKKNQKFFKEYHLSKEDEQIIAFNDVDFKHLKLQKILYFLYGLYYTKTKTELFADDFVAYKYGPVIEKIYFKIKKEVPNIHANLTKTLFKDEDISNLSMDKKIVNSILDKLLWYSTWGLVDLSHLDNSPWSNTEQSQKISKDEIKKYFSKALIE